MKEMHMVIDALYMQKVIDESSMIVRFQRSTREKAVSESKENITQILTYYLYSLLTCYHSSFLSSIVDTFTVTIVENTRVSSILYTYVRRRTSMSSDS